MKKNLKLIFFVLTLIQSGSVFAKTSPLDASVLLGFPSPGVGISGVVAYRIIDDLLIDADDSMSIEGGLGIISVREYYRSDRYASTVFEIPISARWDIQIPRSKFTVSPEAGFVFISGDSLFIQIGASGFFAVSETMRLRLGVAIGGISTLYFGLNFIL